MVDTPSRLEQPEPSEPAPSDDGATSWTDNSRLAVLDRQVEILATWPALTPSERARLVSVRGMVRAGEIAAAESLLAPLWSRFLETGLPPRPDDAPPVAAGDAAALDDHGTDELAAPPIPTPTPSHLPAAPSPVPDISATIAEVGEATRALAQRIVATLFVDLPATIRYRREVASGRATLILGEPGVEVEARHGIQPGARRFRIETLANAALGLKVVGPEGSPTFVEVTGDDAVATLSPDLPLTWQWLIRPEGEGLHRATLELVTWNRDGPRRSVWQESMQIRVERSLHERVADTLGDNLFLVLSGVCSMVLIPMFAGIIRRFMAVAPRG